MAFQISFKNNSLPPVDVGKIVCVGRNYLKHIQELKNKIPEEPVYFMKPASSLSSIYPECIIPDHLGEIHYECELALLISNPLANASKEEIPAAIGAWGLALDLTLRKLQSKLKNNGLPWEKAKAFEKSCQVTHFLPLDKSRELNFEFSFSINNQAVQKGDSRQMILNIPELIADMSKWFHLYPGDLILTGTPDGVGILKSGSDIVLSSGDEINCHSHVVSEKN